MDLLRCVPKNYYKIGENKLIALGDFRGKVAILSLLYSICVHVCK